MGGRQAHAALVSESETTVNLDVTRSAAKGAGWEMER